MTVATIPPMRLTASADSTPHQNTTKLPPINRRAGCYAYQIDGTSFSEIVVLRVTR